MTALQHARRALWLAGAPIRLALVGVIKVYRVTLSGVLGGQCRFYPSCSHYGEEAIRVHGAAKGSAMAAWRILRCSPLTAGGVDKVPPRAANHPAGKYDGILHVDGGQPC